MIGRPAQPDGDAAAGRDGASPMPFIAALVIIVIVVIGIGISTLTRGDGLTEEDRVARVAVGQNDALQRQNYPDFRTFTCAAVAGTEADMVARQRDSVAKQGARFVDGVTGVVIEGDRATGTATYHFDKAPDNKIDVPVTFVREDGTWKVC
ncbi:hypothetical protein BH09ACT7_BH09ACT7_57960 [soil metagenome]